MVMPYDIQQGIRALSVGFFLSASSMLVLGGLSIGPATAVLLTISLHCSFATFWKQVLGEAVEPEEYLSAPLLLMAILLGTILGSVSAEGDEIAGDWVPSLMQILLILYRVDEFNDLYDCCDHHCFEPLWQKSHVEHQVG